MRRIFVDPAILAQDTLRIEREDHHHLIHVLRMRAGDSIVLLDGSGNGRFAEIESVEKRHLTVRITGVAESPPPPEVHVTVAQAIGKGDRFEEVIKHGTEIGASAFIPLVTERTIARIGKGEESEKLVRWRSIAKSAAEQAGRGSIPEILPIAKMESLAFSLSEFESALILHGGSGQSDPSDPSNPSQVLLLVGPEGGFTDQELESACKAGALAVSLGPFTLRTETAALVALARILDPCRSAAPRGME